MDKGTPYVKSIVCYNHADDIPHRSDYAPICDVKNQNAIRKVLAWVYSCWPAADTCSFIVSRNIRERDGKSLRLWVRSYGELDINSNTSASSSFTETIGALSGTGVVDISYGDSASAASLVYGIVLAQSRHMKRRQRERLGI